VTRRFGENSINLLHGLNSLGSLLGARGDSAGVGVLRRALAIRQSATGPEHPGVAEQKHRLAAELTRLGQTSEAEELARQALDLSTRTLGSKHPAIASARLPLLAEVFDRQGRFSDADRTYETAFAQLSLSGVVPGEMRRNYGRMLLRRADYPRAEKQLLQSYALLEEAYRGTEHPNVQESSRALMQLYTEWGKSAMVERYRVPPGVFVPY
jgi:tetratricopeptide (TPR) repeat protein